MMPSQADNTENAPSNSISHSPMATKASPPPTFKLPPRPCPPGRASSTGQHSANASAAMRATMIAPTASTMLRDPAVVSAAGGISSLAWTDRYAQEFGGIPPALAPQGSIFGLPPASSIAAAADLLRASSSSGYSHSGGSHPSLNAYNNNAAAAAVLSSQIHSLQQPPSDWLRLVHSSASVPGLDSQILQRSATMASLGLTSNSVDQRPLDDGTPATRRMPEFPYKAKKDRIYLDEPGMWDVKCGRGGDSNHHTGNKRYRQLVADMKMRYRNIESKTAKTDLSRSLVAFIESYGGRFIEYDKMTEKYYILSIKEARRKTSQALRETKETKWLLDPSAIAGEVAKKQVKSVLKSGKGANEQ